MVVLDLLLTNGWIVDGSGNPGYAGYVGVKADRVAVVGRQPAGRPGRAARAGLPEARQVLDAAGMVVAPGFIDIHTHSDVSPFVNPLMESAVRQGVTTVVSGNCGSSPAPYTPEKSDDSMNWLRSLAPDAPWDWRGYGEFLDRLEEWGLATNFAGLAGHGTLRVAAMGGANRPPNRNEFRQMARLLEEALDHGAFGVSTGLIYVPGCYADTGELVGLARVAGRHGRLYASHVRGEGPTLFEAVQEAIAVGRESGAPVQVSHLKLEGRSMWGRAEELLDLLGQVRRGGIDVAADQYPYPAWSTGLAALVPPWAMEEGPEGLARLLEDPSTRDRIIRALEQGEPGWSSSVPGVGWENVVISDCENRTYEGRNLTDVARERNQSPADACLALVLEYPRTGVIGHAMAEADVLRILREPDVMVGSDSLALAPYGPMGHGKPHPRSYGTFPRVLGRYVREQGVLSLEAAVRKMTSLPADRLGLKDRGRLAEGAFADLVVFDLAAIQDRATFEAPHQYPTGIAAVFVNGTLVLEGDRHTGALAGRVLRAGR